MKPRSPLSLEQHLSLGEAGWHVPRVVDDENGLTTRGDTKPLTASPIRATFPWT